MFIGLKGQFVDPVKDLLERPRPQCAGTIKLQRWVGTQKCPKQKNHNSWGGHLQILAPKLTEVFLWAGLRAYSLELEHRLLEKESDLESRLGECLTRPYDTGEVKPWLVTGSLHRISSIQSM